MFIETSDILFTQISTCNYYFYIAIKVHNQIETDNGAKLHTSSFHTFVVIANHLVSQNIKMSIFKKKHKKNTILSF